MILTTHSLDAQNNPENFEQLFWLAQGISSFDKEYSRDNSIIGAETVNVAFGNFITANRGLAASGAKYNSYFLFNKADCTVKSTVKNAASIKSFALHYGIIDEKNIKLTPLAEKYLLTQALSLKEYIFVILSKQWCLLDGKAERNLLSVLYEIFTDVSADKIINNDSLWQDEIFKLVTGKKKTATDSCVPRFDVLRNAVNYAGLIFKTRSGNYRIVPEAIDILKIFKSKEGSLRKPNNFYAHLADLGTGIFEVIDGSNASIINLLYPNIKPESKMIPSSLNLHFQKIYYGAPGTGKSNEIKRLTGDGTFAKDFTFRTTFHPDSDYSSFVGAYKPIWDSTLSKIVYDFRPQTFLKAYVAAWTHPEMNVALVIEEINRGNCAQIFGDIFQLLDREADGLSKYPIEADIDMKMFIVKALNGSMTEPWAGVLSEDDKTSINEYYSSHYDDAFAKIKSGDILSLPKNLSILATMNTSDQSLFPMDSAFKRRWEWAYQPIVKGVDSSTGKDLNWVIDIEGYEPIDWWEFLQRINRVVSDLTTSEDKQLGYFFCIPDKKKDPTDDKPTIITAERFVGKVIFYLWNDVFKDYAFDAPCCKGTDEKEVLYAKFYSVDGKSINYDVLAHFFDTLKDGSEDSLIRKTPAPTAPVGSPVTVPTTSESTDGSHSTEEPESGSAATESGEVEDSSSTVEE